MQMGLEYYLEDYRVIISSMRVNITKYNDHLERKLLPDLKKKKDMEVYGIVAELTWPHYSINIILYLWEENIILKNDAWHNFHLL